MEYTKEINKIVEGINFTNKTVKPTKKYKKVCEYCGKEFETNRENKKYCSVACRNSYHVEKYQQKAKVKVEQEKGKQTVNNNLKVLESELGFIPVYQTEKGAKVVYGRDLHEGLEITDRFSRWFERMLAYGFEEDVDYTSVKSSTVVNNGAVRELDDYILKLDMAKEIAMLQRNAKGKQYRQYFIRVEEKYKLIQSQISQEDKAWLELKHSQQDENAQYLINVTTQKLAIEFNKTLAKEIDGEGRRITLTELADKLSQMAGFKIESINITNFLVYKGYFTKEQFPRRGSFIVNGVVIGRLERNYHRQPTEKFLTEFANKGLSLTKPADERGKIVWEFTNKFEKYFEQTFLEEFIYYVQNTEKGWE